MSRYDFYLDSGLCEAGSQEWLMLILYGKRGELSCNSAILYRELDSMAGCPWCGDRYGLNEWIVGLSILVYVTRHFGSISLTGPERMEMPVFIPIIHCRQCNQTVFEGTIPLVSWLDD